MDRRRNVIGVVETLALVGLVGALVVALFGARLGGTGAAQQGTTPEMDAVAVVERVAPAVVTVHNLQRSNDVDMMEAPEQRGSGTGFIIDQEGHIVTNWHVVTGGDEFEVIFQNGEERPAELIGSDEVSDLAVVRVEGELPVTVGFGDSDALRVGEPVLALGSPLGTFTNTVTQGIVSATGRTAPEVFGLYTNLVQHDAAINPGNSGGPLFNAAGEVVGVNTLGIPQAQGLFFAVPASTVTEVTTDLINEGVMVWPFVGVTTQPVSDELAAQQELEVDHGALVVAEVSDESPAGQAGIEEGDVIVAMNGQRIDAENPFVELLFRFDPGDTVTLTVQRGADQLDVEVTLGERPVE